MRPRSSITDSSEWAGEPTIWMVDEETLAAAWPVKNPIGEDMGYFSTRMDVKYILRQASAARRTMLIVSSLSLGLAILIILGTHMLVTGPVVRLLRKVQLVESGQSLAGHAFFVRLETRVEQGTLSIEQ